VEILNLKKSFIAGSNKVMLPVLMIIWGLMILPIMGSAQDFTDIRDAFQESYIQEATGDFSSAINSLKTVYDEKSYEVNLRLGWLSYEAGLFTESVAYYNKAIELMPYAIEPRFGVVYPGAAMGINLFPFDYDGLTMLAWSHFQLKNFREAKVLFQKALIHTPTGSSALEGLELLK
jgi:tetratricopeptide (TPR) repeat protein